MTLEHKAKGIALASLAILAQSAPTHGTELSSSRSQQQTLNLASIAAVRASWIKVPPLCKDRSFPFAPVKTVEATSAAMTELYSALDQKVEGIAG